MAILSAQDLQHFAYCPSDSAGQCVGRIASLPQLAASNARPWQPVRTSSAASAEFWTALLGTTKLYANFWRYAKFAVANQLYMMAEMNGVDFNRIHER